MKAKSSVLIVLMMIMISAGTALAGPAEIPVKNTVTLVDLGAKSCIPCKAMAPILEELKKEYKGRAEVIFIDIRQNPGEAKKFKVSIIPTQILYNRNGKEVFRHMGFLDKKSMSAKIEQYLGTE